MHWLKVTRTRATNMKEMNAKKKTMADRASEREMASYINVWGKSPCLHNLFLIDHTDIHLS